MTRITGRANPAAGYNPGRVPWVDVTVTSRTASAATVRFQVGSDPGSGSTGTFSGALKVNSSSYAVSGSVSGGSAVFWTKSVTYNQAAAFTLSISLTGSIPGTKAWQSTTLSGTFKVPAGSTGTKPGAPSNFKVTRTGDTTATLSFTKGSNATSTQIQASKNSEAWYNLTNPTGTSQAVTGLTVDSQWRFQGYSKNAAGNSSTVYWGGIYTKPKAPTKPSLGEGRRVSWTLPARYVHGVQVRRSDGGTVDLEGRVTTWTDPNPQKPDTTYDVRSWAGPGQLDSGPVYSAWSPASEAALAAFYKPPAITALKAVRANSSGTATQMGTYLRITWSGSVQSVKDGTTELNTMTRTARWRKTGTSTWSQSVISNGVAPAAWTNAGVTVGAGAIAVTDTFEVEVEAKDAWQTTIQATTVSTATVAMSLSKTGVGAGKVWEQGALDVGGDIYVNGHGLTYYDDTRDDNRPPSWYRSNFPRSFYREFKQVSKMEPALPAGHGATFFMMETIVPWSGKATGYPIYQRIELSAAGGEMWRMWRSEKGVDEWGPWNGVGGSTRLIINGAAYQRTGYKTVTSITWSSHSGSGLAYTSVPITPPYTAPDGWGFFWAPSYTEAGYIWGAPNNIGSNTVRLFGSKTPSTMHFFWQLVKVS